MDQRVERPARKTAVTLTTYVHVVFEFGQFFVPIQDRGLYHPGIKRRFALIANSSSC